MSNYDPALQDAYIKRFEYDGSGNPIYVGSASPGAAASDSAWAIQKYTYTGGYVSLIQWAGGGNSFTHVWDNRAALVYA